MILGVLIAVIVVIVAGAALFPKLARRRGHQAAGEGEWNDVLSPRYRPDVATGAAQARARTMEGQPGNVGLGGL